MGVRLIMDIGFINRMAVQRGAGTFPYYYKIVTIISWLFLIFLFMIPQAFGSVAWMIGYIVMCFSCLVILPEGP